MKIEGSCFLITGAAGGIGRATAHHLAGRGTRLLLSDLASDALDGVCAEASERGADVTRLAADLRQSPELPALAQRAIACADGELDALVNVAGMMTFQPIATEEPDAVDAMFRVNVVAPIVLARSLVPHFVKRGHGRVVNVGSIFGSIAFPYFATYSASKFALRGFSEALRRELAGTGVGVTYVAPRATRTRLANVYGAMAEAVKMNMDTPESVAARIVAAIEADDADRYLGFPEKLFVRVNALWPRFVDRALEKQARVMRPFAEQVAVGAAAPNGRGR